MPRNLPCPSPCNVLLIGGGGREHALAWKLRQSDRLGKLWLSDATNAGLAELGEQCPVAMDMSDTFRMKRWCEQNDIHLVVVGPEAPLAAGIHEVLSTKSRLVFGPTKAGAQIESDKAYAKNLMRQASIPTADCRVFDDPQFARDYVMTREDPVVVKATGLAAGKGVVVCDTEEEAIAAIDDMMVAGSFGAAGKRIIVEERMTGQEVSVLALVDGRTVWILDPAQDHKQLNEGDTGPNTGGMGAYCPTPVLDAASLRLIEQQVIVPTVDALKRDGIDYRGVLYAGLMLTPAGPKVLEFNCRFGDPECQPLMARLQGDLVEILWATAAGTLDSIDLDFDARTATCVVMASGGYPGAYEKGKVITGIDKAQSCAGSGEDVIVFHAGTKSNNEGDIITNGGRVLGVTALSSDLQASRDLANRACECIRFEGAYFRKDIGHRVLQTANHV